MNDISYLIPILAGAMLFSAFIVSSRMRLFSLIQWFRIQSFILVLYTVTLGYMLARPELYMSAVLVLIVKVGIVPYFLSHVAIRPGVSQRLESYARPAVLSFISVVLIGIAFYVAHAYAFLLTAYPVVVASSSLILIGLLLLVTRKDLFGQGTGFLTLENGIFVFGLALVNGMPLLLEIGILFDVLIGFVLMLALVYRAQREHASVGTDRMRDLVG